MIGTQFLESLGKLSPEELREIVLAFSPAEWVRDSAIKNEKGEAITFEGRDYLLEPYNDLSADQAYKKGSQVGISTMAVIKAMWRADTANISLIYTMPTDTDVRLFSQMRLKPIINSCERLKARIDDVDNVSVKRLGASSLYFRGTWTETQAISVPSDLNIHDEIDFSRPDIREMYQERLSASTFKWQWNLSTPTIPGFGIDALFEKSDQKTWFVKCDACGEWVDIDFFKNISKKDEHYFYSCKCGAELKDRNNGKWVAKCPGKSVRGYYIPQTIAPWISADDLMAKYLKAKESGKLKNFYNFNLGLAFSGGVSVLNRDIFLKQMRNEDMLGAAEGCVMGVDQGDLLHVEVRKVVDGISKIIHLEITDNFERLSQLMDSYGVRACVIDALPNKHSAKQFRDKHFGRVYLSYYNDRDNEKEFEESAKDEQALVLDRTESLDNSANCWISGQATLPRNSRIVEQFIEQMCNMQRLEVEDKHGQKKYVWKKIGADHFRHTDNYCNVALMKLNEATVRVRFI